VTAGEPETTASRAGTVLVVAADDERRSQYESALGRVRVSARLAVDADEAEAVIGDAAPNVLVLDRGLQRLVQFRLFSLVRADGSDPPTQVLFVGQDGDAGPGDHYLPGQPSAHEVADLVSELLGRVRPATDVSPPAAPVVTPAPDAPTRSRSRLDVILIAIGLVLLILGAILIYMQSIALP
jgi:hypothetical protein